VGVKGAAGLLGAEDHSFAEEKWWTSSGMTSTT